MCIRDSYFFGRAVVEGFDSSKFWLFFSFLAGYFALFSTSTFIFQYTKKKASTLLELLFLYLNAFVFVGFAAYFVRETFVNEMLAAVFLGTAAYYILHVLLFKSRLKEDPALVLSFAGLASFFLAITFPTIFSDGWITIAWSIQAFIMMWLSTRLNSLFLRNSAYILYSVVLFRFVAFDIQANFDSRWNWQDFVERLFIFCLLYTSPSPRDQRGSRMPSSA